MRLLDGEFGAVAVAGDDGVLEGFAFFVLHAEGVAFVVDELDFDAAVGAVVLGVGGAVGEDVLVADGLVDLAEDVGEFALEDGCEVEAAGHLGEGFELVLGLEVVEVADGAFPAAAAALHFVDEGAGADREDGDVGCGFDLGEDFVEGEFREGVAAGADEDDVFSAFDAGGSVEGFVEGVEEVGVGEAGEGEGLEALAEDFLVVGEVVEDVGVEVVGDDGDVVVGAERAVEGGGGVLHVADDVVAVGGEFEEHDGGDGSLGGPDGGDGLGDAVFEDLEVAGFEAGDELVGFVEDDVDVEVDDGDVDAEGVDFSVGIFDLGFSGGGGRWGGGVGVFFLDDEGAVVGLGAGVVGGLVGRRLGGGGLGGGGLLGGDGAGREGKEECGEGEVRELAERAGRAGGAVQAGHHGRLYLGGRMFGVGGSRVRV